MVRIIVALLLVFILIVVLGDTARNISLFSLKGFIVRVLPMLALLGLALTDMLSCSSSDIFLRFQSYLLLTVVLAANAPSCFDEFSPSETFSPASVLLIVLLMQPWNIAGISNIGYDILLVAVPLILLVQNYLDGKGGHKAVPDILYLALDLLVAIGFLMRARGLEGSPWCMFTVSSVLFGTLMCLLFRKFPGGFFRMPVRKVEREETAPPEDCSRMDELFERLEKYMKENEPYLDENLSLSDLATVMLTNKTYLSKTINYKSGMHFCPYVNKYRIEYSLKIMNKDNRVRVMELAVLSGFHSVSTFNMAFRLFMGDTPSEYMRTLRSKGLYRPSRPLHDDGTGAVM